MHWSSFTLSFLILFATLTAGCGRYHFGQPGGSGQAVIYIGQFINETRIPGLEVAVNREIRKQIADIPQFHLSTNRSRADYLLSGAILNLERSLGARRADDTARARSLIMEVDVQFSLQNLRTGGAVATDRSIRQAGVIYDTYNFMEAERQKVPLLGRDLATGITRQVIILLTRPESPENEQEPT